MTMTDDQMKVLREQASSLRQTWEACVAITAAIAELERLAQVEAERDELRRRIDEAPVAWAGMSGGTWKAGQDWRDADHVRYHLSGFGDEQEQAAIPVKRVALVEVRSE